MRRAPARPWRDAQQALEDAWDTIAAAFGGTARRTPTHRR